MNKKILIMTVLLVAVLALFGMANTVKAKTNDDLTQAINGASEGGVVTLDAGETYTLSSTVTINKNLTINLNGATIESSLSSGATLLVDSDKTVKFTGEGTVKNTAGCVALFVKGSATLEGGTFLSSGENNNSYGAVQVGSPNGEISGTLVVNDGTTIKEGGILVSGTGSKLTVNGGTIDAGNDFAISGNGRDTKNSTIVINGGTDDFLSGYIFK